MIIRILLVCVLFLSCEEGSDQKIILSPLFSNGMVLQRDASVSIWGKGSAGQLVRLVSTWGINDSTYSDQNGNWKTNILTTNEPGPHSLTIIIEKEKITINDVLLGEVWLAAGQSNMEMDFDYCCNTTDHASHEIATANYPTVRMFNIKKNLSLVLEDQLKGAWVKAIGEDMSPFSAVGYFFAKELAQELDTPIGIMHASWGGSRLEAWTSHDVLKNLDDYENELRGLKKINEENQDAVDWFSDHPSVPLPSGDFDLFLGDYLRTKEPEIDYLNYFIDGWKALDEIGMEKINGINSDQYWIMLDDELSVNKTIGVSQFKGAVLFRNDFKVEDENNSFSINIKPKEDLPWGLWEYDIFINGQRIGSSLMDIEKDEYAFSKSIKIFDIDPSLLELGENKIILRVLGHPSLGNISLHSSKRGQLEFDSNWECSILAEEFFQIDDYSYPYMALYLYENERINYSDIPKKTIVNHHTLGSLFNGMINPLIPYGIKGIIWYQGETNVERGGPEFNSYDSLFPLMVDDLRERWDTNLPFYYAQIAPYYNYNGMSPYFRDVQRGLLRIQNTGMIVTLDIGENYDIHPSNKHDVGQRFAKLALKHQYGRDIIASGPLFKGSTLNNGSVQVEFHHIGSGLDLIRANGPGFELAGKDRKFFDAKVVNHGTYLKVSSLKVDRPKYLRYAFSDTASAILYNLEGLPASSFHAEINNNEP